MRKPLRVNPKPVTYEAVLWQPDQNGALPGGWPRGKRWATARTWRVSAIDLTLFTPIGPASRGSWLLIGDRGDFIIASPTDFQRDFIKAPL